MEHLERRLLLTVGPDGTPYLYLNEPYGNINHSNELYLTEGQRDRLEAAREKLGQTGPGELQLISNYSEAPDQLSPELAAIVEVVDQLVASGSLQPHSGSGQLSRPYSYLSHALISDRGEIEVSGRISDAADDPLPSEEQLRELGIRDAHYTSDSAVAAQGGDDRFVGWVTWNQLADLAHAGVVEYLQLPIYASYQSEGQVPSVPSADNPNALPFTELGSCGAYRLQSAADAQSPSDLDALAAAPPLQSPLTSSSSSTWFIGPLPALNSPLATPEYQNADDDQIADDDQNAASPRTVADGELTATDQAIVDMFEPLSNDKFCEAFNAPLAREL